MVIVICQGIFLINLVEVFQVNPVLLFSVCLVLGKPTLKFIFSPHSLWFCDISVQQSPQEFVLMAVATAVTWGTSCAVALPGGPAGLCSAWPLQLWVSLVNHCFAFGN